MIQIIPRGKPSFGEQISEEIGGGIARGMERGRERKANREAAEQSFRQKLALDEMSRASSFKEKLALEDYKNQQRQKMMQLIESGKINPGEESIFEEQAEGEMPEMELGTYSSKKQDPFLKSKQYAAIEEHDLSNVASKEADRQFQEKQLASKEVTESYKENKDFIDKVHDQEEDARRKEGIFERMIQLDQSGELSDSFVVNALEQLGLSPEFLKNPANEEYSKLALDLLGGGTLQSDYGSRILQSEFLMAMKRIPTLNQTPEGRRQIIENLQTMLLPAKLKNERLQFYLDRQEKTGKPLPHDLRGKILKDIRPQLEEASETFKQRNGRYKVRQGTKLDEQAVEKYYFLSDGDEKKAMKMMKEDGYGI